MRMCKMCGSEYTLWQARGDGLCPDCGKKEDEQKKKEDDQKKQKQSEDAKTRLEQIATQIVPDDEIILFGVALWDTVGLKLSNTFHLWIGRAFLGMFGDMLHSKTRILGVVVLSRKGVLHTAKIGEIDELSSVDPTSILSSTLDVGSVTKTPKGDISASYTDNTLVVTLTGNKKLQAMFPNCFIEKNESVPSKIISILNKSEK